MIKLLRGDFIRLFKSKIFWLGFVFMFGFSLFAVYVNWRNLQISPDYYNPPDGILLTGATYISIVIAIFTGIYIGVDYSNGTIRNKHVMGHSRVAMYLSNLIICVTASVIMHIAYIAVLVGAVGMGIINEFEMSTGNIAALTFTSVFSVSAISAILLFVCMLISSRSAGVVSAIILSIMLVATAGHVDSSLREKEYATNYAITIAEDGGMAYKPQEFVKNPKYLTGAKRKVYEFANDFLPVNQICQLTYGDPSVSSENIEKNDNNAWFPLYSLSLIVLITTAGIIIFRKKDLK